MTCLRRHLFALVGLISIRNFGFAQTSFILHFVLVEVLTRFIINPTDFSSIVYPRDIFNKTCQIWLMQNIRTIVDVPSVVESARKHSTCGDVCAHIHCLLSSRILVVYPMFVPTWETDVTSDHVSNAILSVSHRNSFQNRLDSHVVIRDRLLRSGTTAVFRTVQVHMEAQGWVKLNLVLLHYKY